MVGMQLARGPVYALLGQELAVVVPVVASPTANRHRRFAAHVEVLAFPASGRTAEPQGQRVALFGDELRIIRQWLFGFTHSLGSPFRCDMRSRTKPSNVPSYMASHAEP